MTVSEVNSVLANAYLRKFEGLPVKGRSLFYVVGAYGDMFDSGHNASLQTASVGYSMVASALL
jgi:hypothetical protein